MTRPATTDHAHHEAVSLAASWLANEQNDPTGRAIVPEMMQRFGLTAVQAVEAIQRAQMLRRARSL